MVWADVVDEYADDVGPAVEESTYVVMEEVGNGPAAQRLATSNPGQMHRGHDLWDVSLRFLCET
jgi:hypothetical protein